jgi:glutamine amidotransferase PdxT
MGFPDIDWDAFFAPGGESQEIEKLVSRLEAAATYG